jgi:hypothetical protein
MAERVKLYEKKCGGWRLCENRDEQVYNIIKEFHDYFILAEYNV